MDRNILESCTNVKEIAREIWRQSYEVKYERYEEGVALQGFYLRPIREINNTHFDIFFKLASDTYCKIINEFDEGRRYDGALSQYEIMINWLEGKYKFKYIPTTCEEFIEIIFDEEKALETTKYLNGVLQRLTRNALYCSKTKSSISETKYYTHDKERTYYVDVIKTEIDKPYIYGQGENFEFNSHKILDEYLLKENKCTNVENEIFGIDEAEEGIYKYLYNNFLTERNRTKIDNNIKDNNRNYYIRKKLERDIDNYNTIAFHNGKIKWGGNFLDFADKFMQVDSYKKLQLLKKNMRGNTTISSILIDCIYSLDTNILKEFVKMINSTNVEERKEYCRSNNFKIIIDTVLEEYFKHQSKIKDIYLYNENERLEKVKKVEEYIHSLERKDGTLGLSELKLIFELVVELYEINLKKYKKRELTLEFRLKTMKELGYVFVEVSSKIYKVSNLSY